MTKHICINIEGLLKWKGKKKLRMLFQNDNGTIPSEKEVMLYIAGMQEKGYKVLPVGNECDAFDKETGCRGHINTI